MTYEKCREGGDEYLWTPEDVGRRSLAARCLSYLLARSEHDESGLALRQYQSATNMTDAFGALVAMNGRRGPERDEAMSGECCLFVFFFFYYL